MQTLNNNTFIAATANNLQAAAVMGAGVGDIHSSNFIPKLGRPIYLPNNSFPQPFDFLKEDIDKLSFLEILQKDENLKGSLFRNVIRIFEQFTRSINSAACRVDFGIEKTNATEIFSSHHLSEIYSLKTLPYLDLKSDSIAQGLFGNSLDVSGLCNAITPGLYQSLWSLGARVLEHRESIELSELTRIDLPYSRAALSLSAHQMTFRGVGGSLHQLLEPRAKVLIAQANRYPHENVETEKERPQRPGHFTSLPQPGLLSRFLRRVLSFMSKTLSS